MGLEVWVAESALAPERVPRPAQPLAVDHARVDGHRLAHDVVLLQELLVLGVAVQHDVHELHEGDLAALLLVGGGVEAPFKVMSVNGEGGECGLVRVRAVCVSVLLYLVIAW